MLKRLAICVAAILSAASSAAAQQKDPVGPFAVDLRAAYGRHKAEPTVAADLGIQPANLPSRTVGLVAAAHLYPLRSAKVTLGVGGNLVIARGSRSLTSVSSTGVETTSPTARRHFTTVSPELSLNFGHRNGWSYISGGMFGRSKLYVDLATTPAASSTYRSTINYGGGARWFNTDHLALSVDFRWYSVAEQLAAPGLIAQPRTTLLILSGGISIK